MDGRQSVQSGVTWDHCAVCDLWTDHIRANLAARAQDAHAATLDAQMADGFIGGGAVFGEALAQFAGQAAGGRDAQLASIGAGAGGDVDDGAGAASVDTGLAVSFTTGVTTAAPDSDVDGDEGWAGAAASLGGNGGSPSSAGSTRKAGMACANASPPKSERMARTPSFR